VTQVLRLDRLFVRGFSRRRETQTMATKTDLSLDQPGLDRLDLDRLDLDRLDLDRLDLDTGELVPPPSIEPRAACLPSPTGTPRTPVPIRVVPPPQVPQLAAAAAREVIRLARCSDRPREERAASRSHGHEGRRGRQPAHNPYAHKLRALRLLASQVYIEPALPPEVEDLTALVRRGVLPAPGALPSVLAAELAPTTLDDTTPPPLVPCVPAAEVPSSTPEDELRLPRPWWLSGKRLPLVVLAGVGAVGLGLLLTLAVPWTGAVTSPGHSPTSVPRSTAAAAPAAIPAAAEAAAPAAIPAAAVKATTVVSRPAEAVDLVVRIANLRVTRSASQPRWTRRARRQVRRGQAAVDVDALLTASQERARRPRRATRAATTAMMFASQVDVDGLLTAGAERPAPEQPARRRLRQGIRPQVPDWAH